jgi:hypothetical protein
LVRPLNYTVYLKTKRESERKRRTSYFILSVKYMREQSLEKRILKVGDVAKSKVLA